MEGGYTIDHRVSVVKRYAKNEIPDPERAPLGAQYPFPMSKPARPTQADVARLAGVSVATVSYVASGRTSRSKPASPETQERVLAAMEELGYRPQWAARALRRQRTGLLAVLTYAPLNPWAEELLNQVQERAAGRATETVILRYTDDEHLARQVKLIRGGLADAVLVLGLEDMPENIQARLAGLPVPVLAIANDGPKQISLVRQREKGAIVDLFAHLSARGVTTFHYVAEASHIHRRVRARRTGWVTEAAQALGFEPVLHHITALPTPAEVAAVMDTVATDGSNALVCASDRTAIPLLWASLSRGISVPDQLRISGMGNIVEGEVSTPALTTLGVRSPDYRAAIDHLLTRVEDPSLGPTAVDVPWELVTRGSA